METTKRNPEQKSSPTCHVPSEFKSEFKEATPKVGSIDRETGGFWFEN